MRGLGPSGARLPVFQVGLQSVANRAAEVILNALSDGETGARLAPLWRRWAEGWRALLFEALRMSRPR